QNAYAQAIKLRAKLVDDFPHLFEYEQALANTHYNLGLLFVDHQQSDKAQGELEEALRLQNELARKHPQHIIIRYEAVRSLRCLAQVHQAAGHPDEATAAARRAVKA